MKKLFCSCFIIVIALHVNAQAPRTMEIQKQNMKVLSPAAEVNMRNDLSRLKIQSVQLCDSVATLQQRINEITIAASMKDLQSKGASDETVRAMALQQQIDRINKMMAILSNMLRKMHETSTSIIGNLK